MESQSVIITDLSARLTAVEKDREQFAVVEKNLLKEAQEARKEAHEAYAKAQETRKDAHEAYAKAQEAQEDSKVS